jgi:hypothetical protein
MAVMVNVVITTIINSINVCTMAVFQPGQGTLRSAGRCTNTHMTVGSDHDHGRGNTGGMRQHRYRTGWVVYWRLFPAQPSSLSFIDAVLAAPYLVASVNHW